MPDEMQHERIGPPQVCKPAVRPLWRRWADKALGRSVDPRGGLLLAQQALKARGEILDREYNIARNMAAAMIHEAAKNELTARLNGEEKLTSPQRLRMEGQRMDAAVREEYALAKIKQWRMEIEVWFASLTGVE